MKTMKTFHYPTVPGDYEEAPEYKVNDEGWVVWRGIEMDADPDTFVALSNCWGVDAEAVYVQDSRKRIDRASFRLLNPVFAVDRTAAYDWEGRIKGADPKSFETIDSGVVQTEDDLLPGVDYKGYARDRSQVYFHDQMEGRAGAIKSADVKTFRSFGNGYGADANSVYLGKAKVPKADPETWVYLGRNYSMDNARVWFLNREIKGVQRSTFCVVNLPHHQSFATDGLTCFKQDRKVTEAEFHKDVKAVASRIAKMTPKWLKLIDASRGQGLAAR